MALNFANLFMADFEEHVSTQPIYYRRYIDDILFIWSTSPEDLATFQQSNGVHLTIKFTFEQSTERVQYLDIHLEDTKCFIKPHFKKTNTFSYVMGSSYYPPSIFKEIVKGENTRILRNCSKSLDYIQFLETEIQRQTFSPKFT